MGICIKWTSVLHRHSDYMRWKKGLIYRWSAKQFSEGHPNPQSPYTRKKIKLDRPRAPQLFRAARSKEQTIVRELLPPIYLSIYLAFFHLTFIYLVENTPKFYFKYAMTMSIEIWNEFNSQFNNSIISFLLFIIFCFIKCYFRLRNLVHRVTDIFD